MSKDVYTVITGASKGLGKCLAIECAKRGRNLILVALPHESILDIAKQIAKQYNISVVGYETNLTNENNIKSLADWIHQNYSIDILINNAGIGGTRYFDEVTTDYLDSIIQLNMIALVHLTHRLLPILRLQNKAFILNISSLAAFGPLPFKTVYPASKAFVSSFSRGLNAELKNTNISVSVAHPGGMATNPEIAARMDTHNALVKASYLSPEETAKICIEKTLAKKTIIVPGFTNKLSRFLIRIFPEEMMLSIVRKNFKKEILTKAV